MDDRARLESMYDSFAHKVYSYALRNCGPDDASDIVSETFAVAAQAVFRARGVPLMSTEGSQR